MQEVDLLIIGGGPAGLAAAITARMAGKTTALAARPRRPQDLFGESLSPAGIGLLARLGLDTDLKAAGHLPCYANKSAWGTNQIFTHDYLRDPRGHGWHLDRAAFEASLRQRAEALGVDFWEPIAVNQLERQDTQWRDTGSGRMIGYVIDASGRPATFARRQGAKRVMMEHQVALISVLQMDEAATDPSTLVETIEQGWWYSAPLPHNRMALALFTDADLHNQDQARGYQGWSQLLDKSRHTRRRLGGVQGEMILTPRFVDAGSSYLEQAHGPGWLAVGDAAMSYDPISAHGITLALRTGIDGANAFLANRPEDIHSYQAHLTQAFNTYRQEWQRIYQSEQRMNHAPYWQRRTTGMP